MFSVPVNVLLPRSRKSTFSVNPAFTVNSVTPPVPSMLYEPTSITVAESTVASPFCSIRPSPVKAPP